MRIEPPPGWQDAPAIRMNVLYVDHTSLVSGAQRALLDLVEELPASVHPAVMCPAGPLAEMTRELGVPVLEFGGTSGSLRLHPWQTPRALTEIVASAIALKRAARDARADVVHANSIRAGLIAGCARGLRLPPTVVHVHDALPATRSADVVRAAVGATADALITISDYVTRNFTRRRVRGPVHMLHNPLDTTRFDASSMTRREARAALGLDPRTPLIGVIAQITPWKGQDTAVRALALLRERVPDARLLLVGEPKFVERNTRYDNLAYLRSLRRLVSALALEDGVEFWGERRDVATIMRALDVLAAPSWEEPFGRSVIEAMALETAVAATSVGGPAEYIDDGVDGILVPPRDPAAWAEALARLLRDATWRDQISRRAAANVRTRFDRRRYAAQVLEVYDSVVAARVRR